MALVLCAFPWARYPRDRGHGLMDPWLTGAATSAAMFMSPAKHLAVVLSRLTSAKRLAPSPLYPPVALVGDASLRRPPLLDPTSCYSLSDCVVCLRPCSEPTSDVLMHAPIVAPEAVPPNTCFFLTVLRLNL